MSQILTISNDLRTIDIPRDFVLGVESDDDVNRVYFSLPAMYGDTALWPYKIRINYMNANGEGDMYTVPDEDKEILVDSAIYSMSIKNAVAEIMAFANNIYTVSQDRAVLALYYHKPEEPNESYVSLWFDMDTDTIYAYRLGLQDQQWHNIETEYSYDTNTREWSGYSSADSLKTVLRLVAHNWTVNENAIMSYSENMPIYVARSETAENSFLTSTNTDPSFLFAGYTKDNQPVQKLYQYVPTADNTAREWIEVTNEDTFGVVKNAAGDPIYDDNYHIRFSWLVGRHACEIKGKVRFIVCLKLTDGQGVITNEFNTAVHEVPVLEGLETSEAIVQEREDIIEAILLRMDKIESIDIEGGYDRVIEVLDSIPEDYSELSQDVSDLKDDLDDLDESVFIVSNTHSPIEWEQGSLHPTGGGKINSTDRIRTNAFSKGDIFSIYPSAGYMIELAAYDAENNNAYVGMWQGDAFNKVAKFFSSGIIMRNMPETYLYKIVLKSSEEEEIDPTYYIDCNIKKESYVLKTDFDPSIANNAYNMAQSMQEGLLPRLNFGLGNIGSSGNKISSKTVCCSKTAVKFDRDTFIRCVSSEYLYTLRRYSGEEINASNYIDYLGSFYGTYKLKAGTYYVIAIAKRTAETITDVNEYAKQIEVWSPMYLEEMRKYELDRFAPFGNTRRKIYAHKGITLHEPENTVPSFEAAGIGGAWAIETDIQATSDGHLICMHDMTVDRTTTGTGTIANMTFAEIEQLSIKDHPDLKVPTVEQYLEICKTYGCVPCMELKNVASSQEMITKLLQTITDYGFESTAVILCSTYSIGYVQCINHKIRCIFIIDPTDLETWIPRAQRYFNVSVTMASGTYTVTHEIIKQLHEAGLVVNVGGVNTVEDIKRYFAMGADSVSSDFIATY